MLTRILPYYYFFNGKTRREMLLVAEVKIY